MNHLTSCPVCGQPTSDSGSHYRLSSGPDASGTDPRPLPSMLERASGRAIGGDQSRPGAIVGRRTLAQRQRASTEAGRKLAELGA